MTNKRAKLPDRLKKRSEFLRVKDEGRKWVSPTVIVQAGKAQSPSLRFGVTATKKLGNAVLRNRVKRRLREAARKVLAGKTLAEAFPPADIVLIGRVETAACPFETLVKDLRWCLKRLEVGADEKNADAKSKAH
jgi:ribonuclease P protein component